MAGSASSNAMATIRSFGLASGNLDRQQLRDMEVACHATKMVLDRKAEDLISNAGGMPVLSSKSCDGTPMNIRCSSSLQLGTTGKKVVTRGRRGVEFLVGHQFLRTRGLDGQLKTAVRLTEAVPLEHSTGTAAIWAASQQGWKWLRELGHRGCAIEHFVWDRKGITKLERDTRRWDELKPQFGTCPPDMSLADHRLTDFLLIVPCALHDLQNAFKWGLSGMRDPSLMRDIYITVESLRNSMNLLSSRVSAWICQRLCFHEDRGPQWRESQIQLWRVLALDPMTTDLVVEELQLCWADGRLWIKDDAQVAAQFLF